MSKPAVYDQFDKAFNRVSAYIVMNERNEVVAKVAIKFPADGAGRLYAYVHWLGTQMVRGSASGYGYDKRSAAVADAVKGLVFDKSPAAASLYEQHQFEGFRATLEKDGGEYWDTRLRNAGFMVVQAI